MVGLQKLREERSGETRLGEVLSQGVRTSRENAAPGSGSEKVPPQMQTEGKVDSDGPKSSHPPVVGEKGRPTANDPPQKQTEGPAKMRNTFKLTPGSAATDPCLEMRGLPRHKAFSTKLFGNVSKAGPSAVAPESMLALPGDAAFSSTSITSRPMIALPEETRKHIFENFEVEVNVSSPGSAKQGATLDEFRNISLASLFPSVCF